MSERNRWRVFVNAMDWLREAYCDYVIPTIGIVSVAVQIWFWCYVFFENWRVGLFLSALVLFPVCVWYGADNFMSYARRKARP